jgi:hypothetical protein
MTIFLLALALGLGTTAVILKIRADRARARYEAERAQIQAERDRLAAENQALEVYRPILDVRAEAERILQEAQERITTSMREAAEQRSAVEREVAALSENAKRDAQALEVLAKADVEQMRIQAAHALKSTQERVDSMMKSANREAETVVANANKRAQEIAGDAFQAVQNAERFERAAKAMKNIIEGYGDQWVIPSRSLLDDLAEEYAFAEAGTELKNARDRTRLMVKRQIADLEIIAVEKVQAPDPIPTKMIPHDRTDRPATAEAHAACACGGLRGSSGGQTGLLDVFGRYPRQSNVAHPIGR